ncbi:MAG TPA: YdcF family protein [Candidatus Acidoferrales bacterium]|nr:YdcF family protein [Candidatus Acidoferrales bacterium]
MKRRDSQRGGIFSKLLFLIFVVVLVAILYVARYPILRFAGDIWIVDETPQVSDVIVILSDDNYGADRAARAAQLFKSGMAPRVLASGRLLRPYAGIAELMERDLKALGVPANAIVPVTHRATNTREEAIADAQAIAAHGWKKVLLVTSNYHTRRANYIFERALPAGTELRVVSAPDSEYDPNNWWRTRNGLKRFLYESAGYVVAMWEMRHSEVQTSWMRFDRQKGSQRLEVAG